MKSKIKALSPDVEKTVREQAERQIKLERGGGGTRGCDAICVVHDG